MKKVLLIVMLMTGIINSIFSQYPFIISSYIRGNFYNNGRISAMSMNECTDLICIGILPAADGSLLYERFISGSEYNISGYGDLISSVRSKLINNNIRLRAGVSGGEYWKTMIADNNAREKFAYNIKNMLERYGLDGVDLDFEWAQTTQEYNNYSEAIIQLRNILGNEYFISVSLHPISYKISLEAIEAVDYVSLQCYGPDPKRFLYNEYVNDLSNVQNYGISSDKLVAGVPFYGVSVTLPHESEAYYNFVHAGDISSPATNIIYYNGIQYIFNGQDEIGRKTQYALNNQLRGMMFWDLATDVTYSNKWSLLRAMKNTISDE